VSDRTDSVSACFGPAHCQNGALGRSNPKALAILAPTMCSRGHAPGMAAAKNTATHSRPMTMPR